MSNRTVEDACPYKKDAMLPRKAKKTPEWEVFFALFLQF